MIIEHSIHINADLETVWNIFTDLTCWQDWNTVINDVSSDHDELTEGASLKFCLRPFDIPVFIEPIIKEIIPKQKIVWAGKKHGIRAHHEFIFSQEDDVVCLTSRETFRVNPVSRLYYRITMKKLHQMSVKMLQELKDAAEKTGVAR